MPGEREHGERDVPLQSTPSAATPLALGKQTPIAALGVGPAPSARSPASIAAEDDAMLLAGQVRGPDAEIPVLEGALLATRLEAVKRGMLSRDAFDAGLALSHAMTALQPAVAAAGRVDGLAQHTAAQAAQHLFAALKRDTAGIKWPATIAGNSALLAESPYTGDSKTITHWSTTEIESPLAQLPHLIWRSQWREAFRGYHRLMEGLDRWVADQLRARGGAAGDEARGNAQQHASQLVSGLEQIAGKHATRLPAIFRPAGSAADASAAIDAVPMSVYVWEDEAGKFHVHDLTTPPRPHAQVLDGAPSVAAMNRFFEEVARYPEGTVRYVLPDGGEGSVQTTGKTKWFEWAGYAGLAIAAAGLALATAGASVPATVCFAAGAIAGGVSAVGHLVDSARLGTATTASVVLDVAQLAASFASAGALSLTLRAGGAAAAIANSRWFLPLVGAAAGADVVQLVALSELTYVELTQIENGAGTPEDKQRAIAVLLTQLAVTGGLTALSVHGARSARALAGLPLEIAEHNGANVLRVVDEAAAPAQRALDADHWLTSLERSLDPAEQAKLAKMARNKTPQQVRDILGDDLDAARTRVRSEVQSEQQRTAMAAASKQRAGEFRAIVDGDPVLQSIIGATTPENLNVQLPKFRDRLVATVLRGELAQAYPSADVLEGVKIYEKLPERTVAERVAKYPTQEPDGLVEYAEGLYMQRGEMDFLVIERQPSGRARIVARQEIKTGVSDTHADAHAQLETQSTLLRAGAAGSKEIRLEVGGRDVAGEIDLASDLDANRETRGPAGKRFDKSLGISARDLERLCKEVLVDALAAKGTR